MNDTSQTIGAILAVLATLPSHWDGRTATLAMKDADYAHWRQMEWIGFYFQYLCETELAALGMKTPGNKYGRATFDGFLEIDWDFKAHSLFDASGKPNRKVPVNDLEAIEASIEKYGVSGLIIAQGVTVYDTDGAFKIWHDLLKGKKSTYVLQNELRKARNRLRKTAFQVKAIEIYLLTAADLKQQKRFQEGMRNSDGSPRRAKLLLDLDTIKPTRVITL